MEDLDSLLEDLGRGKNTNTAKKTRPPSSRVDLNELEDLMEDLAAPTSKQTPAPAPVTVQAWSAPKEEPATNRVIASPPIRSNPVSTPSSPPVRSSVDDLDELMESLNVTSRSTRRTSSKPNLSTPPPDAVPIPAAKLPPVSVKPPTPVAQPPAPFVQQPVSPPPARNNLPPPAPQSKGDDLDNLLQNLSSQMNNIDAENPASRGTCGTCKQAIIGEIIQALGKTYHPEHFVCGNCREPLGTRSFFENVGVPFCERCFQELHCPKCAHCDQPVLDRCITALGKKWHVDHFICTQCLKPFGAGNFYERDGRPYCEADFFALYAPKCTACNEPIRGDCINALGSQWHSEHFVCTYCQKSFVGGSFFEHNGKPYCETHYHQQTGSLCSGCGKPITGRCVNALEKKWHPEHFVCAFCMNPLAGGSFTEHNSKAYCRECHGKLFGGA